MRKMSVRWRSRKRRSLPSCISAARCATRCLPRLARLRPGSSPRPSASVGRRRRTARAGSAWPRRTRGATTPRWLNTTACSSRRMRRSGAQRRRRHRGPRSARSRAPRSAPCCRRRWRSARRSRSSRRSSAPRPTPSWRLTSRTGRSRRTRVSRRRTGSTSSSSRATSSSTSVSQRTWTRRLPRARGAGRPRRRRTTSCSTTRRAALAPAWRRKSA
mmetsp:Transcript_42743/g.89289  ORF Transcript_42743/g.89289 Transcript_42743/m.89289 type:complete len:216 (+) Transcript_42743:190-837(+)